MIYKLHTAIILSLAGSAAAADTEGFAKAIQPFFKEHCTKCHGAEKKKGDTTLHDLTAEISERPETWSAVYDMLSLREMPPEDEPQPDAKQTGRVAAWVREQLQEAGVSTTDKRDQPGYGNYVDHDTLFNKPPTGVAMPPPRLWRVRPKSYDAAMQSMAKTRYTPPFDLSSTGTFKDYANLYKLDSGTLGLLLGNAQTAAAAMTKHKIESGKAVRDGWSVPQQFLDILDPSNKEPSEEQLTAALRWQFGKVLQREPSPEEESKMLAFFRAGIDKNGKLLGLRNMIAAVLLTPETLYRTEIGGGEPDRHGRVRLSGREIAYSIAYALTDRRPDDTLLKIATEGGLANDEGVAAQVERLLADPKTEKPRLLGFFREYFGYPGAEDVFKDEKLFPQHKPRVLVSDTDRLVSHILAADKDVFRRLLTTRESFVNYAVDRKTGPRRAENQRMVHLAYNLPPDWKFVAEQPFELPGGQRAGILTQPSWLVANSGNFDNDIIHRGKWVREKLLGGTVPDLPITVDAQLPEEPDQTLRHRMRVTREEYCWKCHKQMNPLGETFEMFDHFGRWRPYEVVLDAEATEKNVDSKGKPRGDIFKRVALESGGAIGRSGDAKLDGEVMDAVEMIHKIAATDRARQVWIRHAFRYYLGRNETLDDAATLQQADRVYRDSGGSFNSLVVALLTSDSFLYRTANER